MLGGCGLGVPQVFADLCAKHNDNFHHSRVYYSSLLLAAKNIKNILRLALIVLLI